MKPDPKDSSQPPQQKVQNSAPSGAAPAEQSGDKDRQSGKKLGLSKVVYGLGMSARDGLITIVVGTAALFPVFYYGQDKSKTLEKMAQWPARFKETWHKSLGDNAGKASSALTVSAGLALLASHITNLPGLVIGARKVTEAEQKFDDQLQTNAQLQHENIALSAQLKHQAIALSDAEMKNTTPTPQAYTITANNTTSTIPAPVVESAFAEKLASTAGNSNTDKLAAKRSTANQPGGMGGLT